MSEHDGHTQIIYDTLEDLCRAEPDWAAAEIERLGIDLLSLRMALRELKDWATDGAIHRRIDAALTAAPTEETPK